MAEGALVRFENVDGIGVITIDNPPVNALSPGVPEGIIENVERGNADPADQGDGADRRRPQLYRRRRHPQVRQPPPPPVLGKRAHDALDASQKPVVAAIHGYALGGGFEIALASNYRIAVPSAKVGLPEVLIGILPGSGGTQRLPRLIGPKAALEMIVSGRHVPAEEAKRLGIIDELVPEGADLRQAAIAIARRVADTRPLPRIRDHDEKLAEAKADPGMFDAMRKSIARRARNQKAPYHCIASVENACNMPFDDGVARERELFNELENSAEARALRYAFFAEREVARLPDIPRDTPLRQIQTAAIVGAGTMGGGIAMSFAEFGFPVKLLEVDEDALARGLARIRANYQTSVSRGSLSTAEMERRLGLIEGVQSYDDIAQADVVIEAVFERIPVKEEVFAKLDATMKPGALLFSNTSGIDIDIMANATKRPQDVAGTHFFAPANVMKLFEVVRGAKSAPDTLMTAMDLGRKIGKISGDGRQLRRLCRQPQPHPVRHRDEHHGRGGLPARAGRQGNGRFRLPDRAVRDCRPVRARHRL